jgi:molybdopterin-containing oxidoreductase family iron-sulfur binding subunit
MNTLHPWEKIWDRSGAKRPPYWRSLEELVATDSFQEMLQREFPEQAAEWTDPITRRHFLMLMGASLALAGVTGCSGKPAPAEKIMPYARQPEEMIPGKPLFYATAMTLGGLATGLLVESHEGRPTKVEGNPRHPASLGATDVFAQASILGLYDPDRSQSVTYAGQPRAWDDALLACRKALEAQRRRRGAGLRVLTETITSPTLAHQLAGEQAESLLKEFPEAQWHQYDPARSDNALEGSSLAFGRYCNTVYHLSDADVILALDADLLSCGPGHLRYVREFMGRRRVRGKPEQVSMNRLYVVESMPSTTGAVADHRLALQARDVETLARAVAAGVGQTDVKPDEQLPQDQRKWISALVKELNGHRGRSLVIAGDWQPPAVHALVHALNRTLGNVGKTVTYTDAVEARPVNQLADLQTLVRDMEAGSVELILILGGNPVFTAPADLDFAKHLQKVPLRLHLGLYQDETAVQCHWHIPETHYLEAWSDARAYDGTVSIIQPLIAPLYGGKSSHELLAALTGPAERPGYDIVRDYWREHWPKSTGASDFERAWNTALHEGSIVGTALPAVERTLVQANPPLAAERPRRDNTDYLEIVFRPDPTIHDGRFANNSWLQELPKPLTKLTWDNAVFISPATAEKHGLTQTFASIGGEHGHALVAVIELLYAGRTIKAPVWILPGHADDSVTVHFGYGRTSAGTVGTGVGFNAYSLRTSEAPWFGTGLRITKTGERYPLACTQMHHGMEGRDPVRASTLKDYQTDPHVFAEKSGTRKEESDRRLHHLTLYDPVDDRPPKNKWGMVIDLAACTGCSACVVACQAENNIPVVGKTEVTRGREMHWLRIDRYYVGAVHEPHTYFQPVPCMHCENAPCELVCPVGATVHSADGLNDMIYNRCVGTRYCSNNCPYKVRRFNFLAFADFATESLKLGRNPNVTVRSRGVMEKCTYCVQRIRAAQIEAEIGGRPVRDGDVITACQAACPAEAILFGDMNDRTSRVVKAKAEPLNYGLLAELNTQPRTTYLPALRNPNPDLV